MTHGEQAFLDLGLWAFKYFYEHDCFDIDSGDFQNYLDQHMIEAVEVDEPCHPELCKCQEFGGWPQKCSRLRKGLPEVIYDHWQGGPQNFCPEEKRNLLERIKEVDEC